MTSVIKSCENCNSDFSIIIGSGRFCSVKCSRSFATKNKRKEINEKVSKTLTGKSTPGRGFVSGFDPRRKVFTKDDRVKAAIASRKSLDDRISKTPFELLSKNVIKCLILSEQSDKCLCGIDSWNGVKLSLQLDHINGDRRNNTRENLRMLCPNCHSITPTYGGRNKIKRKVLDKELVESLKSSDNIHQALKKVGLENGRNYQRAKKLVVKMGVEPTKRLF